MKEFLQAPQSPTFGSSDVQPKGASRPLPTLNLCDMAQARAYFEPIVSCCTTTDLLW
ncbi:Hypothetical predicted protein [Marmota monax]|uniref:Uncharacterized protein n=1 Tax=Marmota monax TaxID=9995 RepID=A0A5E4AHW7_MARMO|nr:hypothetical protein GHT09_000804 [Marmota monax]VTJ56052.1 Hypothetical predicted protein [Marmota monax]